MNRMVHVFNLKGWALIFGEESPDGRGQPRTKTVEPFDRCATPVWTQGGAVEID